MEIDREHPLIVRIPNTLYIEYICISEALLEKARNLPNVEVLEEPQRLGSIIKEIYGKE